MVSKEVKSKLKLRKRIKKAKPDFMRQETFRQPSLRKRWKRPKGKQSKLRMREKARGKLVSPGYGSPKEARGLNRKGYREVLVSNPGQVGSVNAKEEMIVISSTVSRKKRLEIMKAAEEKKAKISNLNV
jgi:large subunit ribosomal protein L32e